MEEPNKNGAESGGRAHSLKCVRGIVKSSYAKWIKPSVSVLVVNEETPIPDELVERILDEVGGILDLTIPRCRKPRHGWKISTLVGYIYGEQDSFESRR